MQQVTLEQAKERLGDLVDAVVRGDEVVVLKNDRARRRLPQYGSARGLIEVAQDFDAPLDDFREYME